MSCHLLDRKGAPRLAYTAEIPNPDAPVVLFLSGYRSDQKGAKITALIPWAREKGMNLVRFDYSGCGESEGNFDTLCISDWIQDTCDILDHVVPAGPVILVGSSMGGWIALRVAEERKDRIRALVGVSAAPDFTPDLLAELTADQRAEYDRMGLVKIGDDAGRLPYVVTRKLIEDGERNNILQRPHDLEIPIVLVHGKKDTLVPWTLCEQVVRAYPNCKIEVRLIEDGDHSLSRPQDLAILQHAILQQILAISV